MDHKCAHTKNEVTYVSMNWLNIWEHVQGGRNNLHIFICYLTIES
jgi:hypothetical protein